MAYETGVPSSQDDLISKLATFIVANGWTQDLLDTTDDEAAFHKGDCYVQFWWADSETVYPHSIGMYQSLGYTGGNDIYNHPDNAGGYTTGYQDYQRTSITYIGDGPYTAYHFFLGTSPDVFYCVLEYAAGIYRHFGFGNIDKIGDWTGGEFVAGHGWHYDSKDNPNHPNHSVLLDGGHVSTSSEEGRRAATIHIEGMPNQDGSSKWGLVGGSTSSSYPGTDRAGEDRVIVTGGCRKSPHLTMMGWVRGDKLSGLIPLIPIPLFYLDLTVTPNIPLYPLGFMPDVFHIQMAAFDAGDEITIGSDTFKIFPMVRKRYENDNEEESWNAGLAYKKVV